VRCAAILADPGVIASAVLDPVGAATFSALLLRALDGPDGLRAQTVEHTERAIALRTVAASYRAVDQAQAELLDDLRWTAGAMAVPAAVIAVPLLAGGAVVATGAALANPGLATADVAAARRLDYQRLLTDHPGIVDNLVGAGPGLVSGLALPTGQPGLFAGDVPAAAHLIGSFYPDGTPKVTSLGVDTRADVMKTPPSGIGDLMAGLDYRNNMVDGPDDQIDVRVITHADGTTSYIVDVPGTKVWDPPGSFNPALNDLGTNVHVMGDDLTARERAIADVLHRAGASPSDPVMLVGHSQGGMVAAHAAQDTATGTFDYNVTHVVTAGSPIARFHIPDHVQVLALENVHDITPHLDAAANPDRANVTTVEFDTQYGTVADNHSTARAYLPAARALDASSDPSVAAYRASAAAFLGTGSSAPTMRAQVYRLARMP
jgi:hypothetical protein